MFLGEDTYSLNKKISTLVDTSVDPAWKIFNYVKLESNDGLATQVFLELMTPALGAGKKIVHVNCDRFVENLSGWDTKSLSEKVLQISHENILLISGSKKPDTRKAVVKTLLKLAQVEEFNPIASWDKQGIKNLLENCAETHKIKLKPDVLEYLVEAVGTDTARADVEFEKLATYANGEILALDEVKILINNSDTGYNQLANAIAAGKTECAAQEIHKLLNNDEHPIKVVAALSSIFRIWLITKAGMCANLPDNEIAKLAGLGNPKRLFFLKQEARYFDVEKLKNVLVLLTQAEAELKSGINNLSSKIIEICL
jgi:DNA polymerase-3 subunit delta